MSGGCPARLDRLSLETGKWKLENGNLPAAPHLQFYFPASSAGFPISSFQFRVSIFQFPFLALPLSTSWFWLVHAHGNRHAMGRAWPRALHGHGPGFGGWGVLPTATAASASATKAGHERRRERGAQCNLPHPLPPMQSPRTAPIEGDHDHQHQPKPHQNRRHERVQPAYFLRRGESRC